MIQSVKFDTSNMNIKKLSNLALSFVIKRLIEFTGIFLFFAGIFIFLSLISYSPEDPNFIFPESSEIKNILGYQGSFVSDIILQSIGLVAFLIPVTFIFTGFNIFKKKEIYLLIENCFFIVIYSICGTFFFSFFYSDNFSLYINGNGGFVGKYLSGTFVNNFFNNYENIFFYSFILVTLLFFLMSINFNPKKILVNLKKLLNIFFKSNTKIYTHKNEVINKFIPQEEIKNLIQEDLPFIKTETNEDSNNKKFIIPSTDLLKTAPDRKKSNSIFWRSFFR